METGDCRQCNGDWRQLAGYVYTGEWKLETAGSVMETGGSVMETVGRVMETGCSRQDTIY